MTHRPITTAAAAPGAAPASPRPAPGTTPAAHPSPATLTPQAYPAELVDAGRTRFAAECGFCHGRDAGGGAGGSDLSRSQLVAEDVRGDRIGEVVRAGRNGRGMPALPALPEGARAARRAFRPDR